MTFTGPWRAASVALAVSAGCSASPSINVGNEADGSVAGSGGASGFGGVGGFGGGDDTLTALITEPPSEVAIEVITISCAGECKQVLAIATGGNDPYTFAWNDGVTTAAREICADEDTMFTVTVSDTAIVDGEFPYASQTTTARVSANVLPCPIDAGADAGAVDATTLDGSDEPVQCLSPDLALDEAALAAQCTLVPAGTDCTGYQMFDLPHAVEAGGSLCLVVRATAPLLTLRYDVVAGSGCALTEPLGGGATLGGAAVLHDICSEHQARVDRIGFRGTREAGSTVTVHQCPCETP